MFNFDNTYVQELEGYYAHCGAAQIPTPTLIKLNASLANDLSIDISNVDKLTKVFSGQEFTEGAQPIALAYAGHQFGHYSPQLGDGRALLLGEVVDKTGARYDIQLKGSGRTPYSRGGDCKEEIGPVLREYLLSEAMHILGIPTSRALAAVSTGEMIMRTEPLPGAILTRVASSHLRIGTFQYFAAQGDQAKLKQLADYAISRHYPYIKDSTNPYLDLLKTVSQMQASLVAKWMLVGFIHGVMNTDNMTISGETIDYGPCAFMDIYAPETVYSSIDSHGRYAYQNQPAIAQWNLARLAETLLPLINQDNEQAVKLATDVLNQFPDHYHHYWLDGMRCKLGLKSIEQEDMLLMNELLASMDKQNVDYTTLFRSLIVCLEGDKRNAFDLFDDASEFVPWLKKWQVRLDRDELQSEESIELMRQVNPIYIARNHLVEAALSSATANADYSKFERLHEVLSQPFDYQEGRDDYMRPATKEFESTYKTFCGT